LPTDAERQWAYLAGNCQRQSPCLRDCSQLPSWYKLSQDIDILP
jgi:hypothetical protein